MKPIVMALLLAALAGCGQGGDKGAATAPGEKGAEAAGAGKAEPGVTRLGLERGYFVRSDLGCAEANADTIYLHRGDALVTPYQACHFDKIKALGDSRYEVAETCTDAGSGVVTATRAATYTVKGPLEFEFRDDEGFEFGAKFCAQAELPEPWRSTDLAGQLK